MTKDLDKPSKKPAGARTNRSPKGLGSSHRNLKAARAGLPRRSAAKAGWTPERRAEQAERVRDSRPWVKSTGPKTKAGKVRSAANGKKHGFRSQAFIERVQVERQLVREAADTIALAKAFLRHAAVTIHGRRITVWTGDPELDSRPAEPNPPLKPL